MKGGSGDERKRQGKGYRVMAKMGGSRVMQGSGKGDSLHHEVVQDGCVVVAK